MTRDQLLDFHRNFCDRARSIVAAKNHDYCGDSDPFSNFRAAAILGVPPEKALLIRVLDKIKRLNTFIDKGTLKVTNEGPMDAIQDILNYMVLLAGLMDSDAKSATFVEPALGDPVQPRINPRAIPGINDSLLRQLSHGAE